MKPDIVFYNECVNNSSIKLIKTAAETCDLLLILGTSLSTHPISEYISFFNHCDLVVMNQSNIQIPERGDDVITVQILGSFRELFDEDIDVLTTNKEVRNKCVYVLSVVNERLYDP